MSGLLRFFLPSEPSEEAQGRNALGAQSLPVATDSDGERVIIKDLPDAVGEVLATDSSERQPGSTRTFSLKLMDMETSEAEVFEDKGLNRFEYYLHIVYISVFAIFGAVLRSYMGRFFGLDCEQAQSGNAVQDFMTPLSERICVTNSGKTNQTGGALFVDLPANILGSFLMGLLSPKDPNDHPIVWFRKDHPLQKHNVFHAALKVGFCGSLTTFSSWNTQLVVMLVGTDTVLGSQVAAALFGYIIGVEVAASSFLFGRDVYGWWKWIHEEPDPERTDSDVAPNGLGLGQQEMTAKAPSVWETASAFFGINVSPFVLVAGLFAAFGVGDGYYHIEFYRKMWMTSALAPFGALVRWRLAKYNGVEIKWKRVEWVPWGTLSANLLASVISAAAEATDSRYVVQGTRGVNWINPFLGALESGFAGSLSTVSTYVREMIDMTRPDQLHLYGMGSLIIAMFLGLMVYAPIIRS